MASPIDNIVKFGEFLNRKGQDKSNKLNSLLHITEIVNPVNVKYEFCLMRCDKDEMREDDFVQYLCDNIVDYALSYAELHPMNLTRERLNQYFVENLNCLASKARDTFAKKSKNTGEPGELFLFIVLESKGFIRLLNKMALKTSSEVPFHGWDAVHVGVDSKGNILFCYGSSKMHSEFSEGVKETIAEIRDFTEDRAKEEHEINLISSYIDSDRFGKYSNEITKLLSPYLRDKDKLGKAHSMFIGYEWTALENPPPEGCTLDSHLVSKYQETHKKVIENIGKGISGLGTASRRDFLVWILPFASLARLRRKFRTKLGVQNSTEDGE